MAASYSLTELAGPFHFGFNAGAPHVTDFRIWIARDFALTLRIAEGLSGIDFWESFLANRRRPGWASGCGPFVKGKKQTKRPAGISRKARKKPRVQLPVQNESWIGHRYPILIELLLPSAPRPCPDVRQVLPASPAGRVSRPNFFLLRATRSRFAAAPTLLSCRAEFRKI